MKVFVEPPIFRVEQVNALLGQTPYNVEAPARPWKGNDVVALLVWQAVSDGDMARLPRLRVIVTGSIGFDHIDVEAARRRGIWVCNVPEYCLEEVADSTLALLLALIRGTVALDRTVRDGHWDDRAIRPLLRVADVRFGIVGFGRIGRAVAKRTTALGIETWATDPLIPAPAMTAAGVRPATREELLQAVTVVSLHLPFARGHEHLIGAKELRMMRPGSYLINAARGQLVDTDALIAALDDGHLAGAALDVLPVEPPTASAPVPRHPKLIVTPHSAWFSERAEREVISRAVGSLKAVFEGSEPEGVVVRGHAMGSTAR